MNRSFRCIMVVVLLSMGIWVSAMPATVPPKTKLTGKVVDMKGLPLPGAAIYIHEARTGTVAGADGQFTTPEIPVGKYLVEVSFQGYASLLEVMTLSENSASHVFTLKETYAEHDAVTVTGVVSATKVKQSAQPVSIIKKGDMLRSSSTNIIDALGKLVPGLSTLSTGPAISKPVIRGLGYNRVVTIHDGIRQEGQQWGDEHGIEIDEYSLQRAEVLKGPASLLYGSDAMAGVLHLITNVPVEQGTARGNLMSAFNDNNGLRAISANLAAHDQSGFNWNVYGTSKSAADYRNKYDGRVFNSRFKENNFGGYLGINKSWGYSHLLISSFNQKLGVVEGARDAATGAFLIFPESPSERIATNEELNSRQFYTPGQNISHFKIASDNNIAVGSGRLALNLGFQRNQRKELGDPDAPTVPELYFDLKTVNYNIQYQAAERNGWRTAYGVNGMFQQNKNRADEVLIPEYNQFDAGAFIYTKKTFQQNLTLSGGIRGDYRRVSGKGFTEGTEVKFTDFTKNFSNFSGSVGLSYNANKDVTLKLNIARGYRAPSVSELSSNGVHEGTDRYEFGDTNLKTETSLQLDAGVEINSEHISINFNGFYNKMQNYIFYGKLTAAGGGDSLVNVGGTDVTAFKFRQSGASLAGFEMNIDLHPHPLDWLHFENSFSLVMGQFAQPLDGSKRLPFIPSPRLQSELRADFKKAGKGLGNLYFKAEMDNVSRQNRIFTGYNTETVTDGYTLFNIGAGTDVLHKGKTLFSLHVGLNNITDVAYQNHLSRLKYTDTNNATGRTGVFNMGRNFSIKLNVPIGFKL
jgi:iron complex outermembrane receptor protein